MSFGFSIGDFLALIKLVEQTHSKFTDAPEQFATISTELKNLEHVLGNFTIAVLGHNEANKLSHLLAGCRKVLEMLRAELGPYDIIETNSSTPRERWQNFIHRFRWDEKKIAGLRTQIVSNISLLNSFSLTHISKITLATNSTVDQLNQRHGHEKERQQHQDIADWLTTVDYSPQQNGFLSRRQVGTGQHILDSDKFQTWLSSSKRTLFCPGIPGAGKTMIACIVVEKLLTTFSAQENVGVAYVYCNYLQHRSQKPEDFLLSVLKQFVQQRHHIPESVKNLYDSHQITKSRPSCDDIRQVLYSCIQLFSRTFILVDALDECHSSDEGRWNVLSEIRNLGSQTSANLFATSRPFPEIIGLLGNDLQKEISATEEDVTNYINGRMPTLLRRRINKYPDLQKEIRITILGEIGGMFLLAKLHMDALASKLLPGHIKATLQTLRTLPYGGEALTILYEQAMRRINDQEESCRLLAQKTLAWITHAKRPLTTLELQHALAVRRQV